ncbi:MAG TPA: GNAT family acetyltransferase [Spirochaetota bacterium]|nr:GNAT family acetyltransferase [Spirochaetota bacterium]HPS86977.1 GNAT family acetyltransferase [Spirochaetota bacterium]
MKKEIKIRNFNSADKTAVIDLWNLCGLVVPSNDPEKDIELKIKFQPELFFVAESKGKIIGSVMTGYDGHRGWLNYLGVHPEHRGTGCGRLLIEFSIEKLKELNCQKINLQVRNSNTGVINFYKKLGFIDHDVTSLQLKL